MRISDWSSDVCSSDLARILFARRDDAVDDRGKPVGNRHAIVDEPLDRPIARVLDPRAIERAVVTEHDRRRIVEPFDQQLRLVPDRDREGAERSEEHTTALQSLMRTSYAVFCLQ